MENTTKAFKVLCQKYGLKSQDIVSMSNKTFDKPEELVEQEALLVRVLAMATGEKYAKVIGEYFDFIKHPHIAVTENMIFENFTLIKVQEKWQSSVDLCNGFTLSVVGGKYYGSTPKTVIKDPKDYSDFEFAILGKVRFVDLSMVNPEMEKEGDKQIASYVTLSDIVKHANKFISIIDSGEEVQYA